MTRPSWVAGAVAAARRRIDAQLTGDPSCRRCRVQIRRGKGYCSGCRGVIKQPVAAFRVQATVVLTNAGPFSPDWRRLVDSSAQQIGIHPVYLLEEVQPLTADTLRRILFFALGDALVTEAHLASFDSAAGLMACPPEVVQPLRDQMVRAVTLSKARAGHLPVVAVSDMHLPPDEIPRLDAPATLMRQMARGPLATPGRLLLTSKKLRFISPRNGAELAWSRVLHVVPVHAYLPDGGTDIGMQIQASVRGIPGTLHVNDLEWALTVADTLIRMDRRMLLPGAMGQRDTRVIPQEVKAAVWQRDQGRCTQCGSDSYLEFDHVIPLSLGGATSVQNIQLLCRACNQAKSDRI